jgi:hypothetical protein
MIVNRLRDLRTPVLGQEQARDYPGKEIKWLATIEEYPRFVVKLEVAVCWRSAITGVPLKESCHGTK